MSKIKNLLKINEEDNLFLANIEISKNDRNKSIVFGYLLSLMIIFSPILITAHFFIYHFYHNLIIIIMSLLIWLFFTLGEIFYHKFLVYYSKNEEKRNLKITHIIDSLVYLVMCLVCSLIIIFLF